MKKKQLKYPCEDCQKMFHPSEIFVAEKKKPNSPHSWDFVCRPCFEARGYSVIEETEPEVEGSASGVWED